MKPCPDIGSHREPWLPWETLVLGGIFLLALALRVVDLAHNPPGFQVDEASNGYDAWAIWLTGKDQWGEWMPIYFRSWGDYKGGLFYYLAAPVVGLLGPTVFAARLPSALLGSVDVLPMYLLTRTLLGRRVAWFGALLLSVSHIHFLFSRIAFRTMTLTTCLITGLALLVAWRARGYRPLSLGIAAGASFGLCFYTYQSARSFVPLLLVGMLVFLGREALRHGKEAGLFAASVVATMGPYVYFLLTHWEVMIGRYEMISISTMAESALDWWRLFLGNYFSHFSPRFLLLHGDPNPMYRVDGHGQWWWFTVPLMALGAMHLWRHGRGWFWLLAWWAAIYPISGSIVHEGTPNSMHITTCLPLWELVAAAGLAAAMAWEIAPPRRKLLAGGLALAMALEGGVYFTRYFSEYKRTRGPVFLYGLQEAIAAVRADIGRYEMIALRAGEWAPKIRTAYFLGWPPLRIQLGGGADLPIKTLPPDLNLPLFYRSGSARPLYILREGDLPGVAPREVIRYPDGNIAFMVIPP